MQKNPNSRSIIVSLVKYNFFIFLSVVIVLFDETIKNFALNYLPNETALTSSNLIELAVHKNFGIAFDLPVWLPLVTILSIVILTGLIAFSINQRKNNPALAIPGLIIAVGATGNLFDRIFYGFTVDYLIIPATRSAFNLSDLIIITGLIFFVWNHRKQKHKI